MQAIVKVTNSAGEEVRQFTVEVEPGKGWKKRAEEAALKLVNDDERIHVIPPEQQPAAEEKNSGKFKFTFEFELYRRGVLKRTTEVSALADDESAALDAAVDALRGELGDDETYRYTNRFRRHAP